MEGEILCRRLDLLTYPLSNLMLTIKLLMLYDIVHKSKYLLEKGVLI